MPFHSLLGAPTGTPDTMIFRLTIAIEIEKCRLPITRPITSCSRVSKICRRKPSCDFFIGGPMGALTSIATARVANVHERDRSASASQAIVRGRSHQRLSILSKYENRSTPDGVNATHIDRRSDRVIRHVAASARAARAFASDATLSERSARSQAAGRADRGSIDERWIENRQRSAASTNR